MTKKYQWVIAALTVTLFFGLISNTIFPNKVPSLKVSSTKGEAMMIYDKNYKFTIINFWATDCPGCVKEMPKLVDTYNKYKKQGIQIIAVSMFYDPPTQVLNFIKNNNIPFPVVIDSDNKIAQQFENIRLTPTSILINQRGQIIDQIVGEIDFNKLEGTLSKNL
ncbi:MAG: TlpA family protein disulfide reductase [Methylophilaceae bacterium]|jgi:peroxiredoxin|nr:TlpA family protein disulfide reductase [Methylophilaceae bacterium]